MVSYDIRVDYSFVTVEMFYDKLEELVGQMSSSELLAIPGIYAALREELNDDVLDALVAER